MKDYITASLDRLTPDELRLVMVVISELLKDNEGHGKEAKACKV